MDRIKVVCQLILNQRERSQIIQSRPNVITRALKKVEQEAEKGNQSEKNAIMEESYKAMQCCQL